MGGFGACKNSIGMLVTWWLDPKYMQKVLIFSYFDHAGRLDSNSLRNGASSGVRTHRVVENVHQGRAGAVLASRNAHTPAPLPVCRALKAHPTH